MVRAFAHGAMGRRIDPSWWTHGAISRSSQCSTTGVTERVAHMAAAGFLSHYLSGPLPYVRRHITVKYSQWYYSRGMCYPICGMVHIKEPLLLIGKSSPCGGSGFPLSLSEWSFTICPTPYNSKIKCVECVVK